MQMKQNKAVLKESAQIHSENLDRSVSIDFYLPTQVTDPAEMSLLLINDGQDLEKAGLRETLNRLYDNDLIDAVLCVGIHAGAQRKLEYGTASHTDYIGRGAKAKNYTRFIFGELLPYIRKKYNVPDFKEKAFAGFSLGALSALDIVWNHPKEFSKTGIFSGSLWWRDKDQHEPTYSDDKNRIMHRQIREGEFYPWLKFFFECGGADEGEDRNQNGVIDSIDDTLDLIAALKEKGYQEPRDINYLLLENGKHDIPTWGLAWPVFLSWAWKKD
jgi:enterochelin esterase-like enzyme